jgi:hypothetical protein
MKRLLCWLIGHDWRFSIQASWCHRCGLDGAKWIEETLERLERQKGKR